MKDAQYYIDRIINCGIDLQELLRLEKEVHEWWKHAPKEEQDLYSESGYGEMLQMACSGIRYALEHNDNSIYWLMNKEWYFEDPETERFYLTEQAPPRAVESFKRWEKEQEESEKEFEKYKDMK